MKIVYYTDQTYLHGGIERVLANKVNYLANQPGFDIHIVTSEQRGKVSCYPMDKRVTYHDLGINYDRKKSYFHPNNFKKAPKHFFALKKKLKEIQPDVVVVCNFAFDFYFIPYILPKIKKIKEFHSSRYYHTLQRKQTKSFVKKLVYKINDFIESKYDYLAILTKDEQQYYASDNTVVIPNGLTSYPDQVAELKNNVAVSAGRIAPVKQFDVLIKTWALVKDKRPDWQVQIYGKGEKKDIDGLQKLITDLGVEEQVKLCGETNDLQSKMLDASLYVMSSQTECFPMVLLEAMSCGLPVVSFDCPHGPSNIVLDGEDGILTPSYDEQQLADAILSLINDQERHKKMGKMARENIKRFQPDYVMDQWNAIFDNRKQKSK